MTIAIDFDGVIHAYSKGWNGGEIYDDPVPGTREALMALKEAKHKIYIFTTRTNKTFGKRDTSVDQKQMIEEYMAKHDIPYDKIWTFGKPMADIFIDDRALSFRGDWTDMIEQVKGFQVWNRAEE